MRDLRWVRCFKQRSPARHVTSIGGLDPDVDASGGTQIGGPAVRLGTEEVECARDTIDRRLGLVHPVLRRGGVRRLHGSEHAAQANASAALAYGRLTV